MARGHTETITLRFSLTACWRPTKPFLITHYPQPSRRGTKQEHTAVSAGLNGSGRKAALNPAFKWVNTTLGNLTKL
jgi:hypothetical protein